MNDPTHRIQSFPYDFFLKEWPSSDASIPSKFVIAMQARSESEISILSQGSLYFVLKNDVSMDLAKEITKQLHSLIECVSYNEHLSDDSWYIRNDIPSDELE